LRKPCVRSRFLLDFLVRFFFIGLDYNTRSPAVKE
jgi:hypothetical protein